MPTSRKPDGAQSIFCRSPTCHSFCDIEYGGDRTRALADVDQDGPLSRQGDASLDPVTPSPRASPQTRRRLQRHTARRQRSIDNKFPKCLESGISRHESPGSFYRGVGLLRHDVWTHNVAEWISMLELASWVDTSPCRSEPTFVWYSHSHTSEDTISLGREVCQQFRFPIASRIFRRYEAVLCCTQWERHHPPQR
jgi:hypothetical protein